MIQVVKEEKVPVYEATCQECGSVIRYMASDRIGGHIICPVCKNNFLVSISNPVDYISSSNKFVLPSNEDDEDIPGIDLCYSCENQKYFSVQEPCVKCLISSPLRVSGSYYKKKAEERMLAVVVRLDVIGKIGEVEYVSDNLDEAFEYRFKHEKDLKLNERYDIYYGRRQDDD